MTLYLHFKTLYLSSSNPKMRSFSLILFVLVFASSVQSYGQRTFKNTEDFLLFFNQQTITRPASWPSILPRSYVVAIDFTLSEEHGVRVLEFSGPLYYHGITSSKPRGRGAESIYQFHRWQQSYPLDHTGSTGHSKLYPYIDLDDAILSSAQAFSQEYGWRLRPVIGKITGDSILPMVILKSNAVAPVGDGAVEVNWNDLSKYSMIFNHPEVLTVTTHKHIQAVLPFVPGISIPSTFFTTTSYFQNTRLLTDFLAQNDSEYFVLKPTDQLKSEGVFLVTRKTLIEEPSSAELLNKLSDYGAWVLQSYMPSTLSQGPYGKQLSTHTGRIFYHIIYDGSHLRIVPLTAYKKINSYKSANAEDFHDPDRVRFSAISTAQEYSREELLRITGQFNHYFSQVSRSLFELSQFGSANIKTPELINRLAKLRTYEQQALQFHTRYVYIPDNRPKLGWWQRYRKVEYYTQGASFFENRMGQIASTSYINTCVRYFANRR